MLANIEYVTIPAFIVAQNTIISPNFLVWKFCGNVQFRDSPETLRKLCLSTKFLHQEIK